MRVLLQRVNEASVAVEGETVGKISRGYLLFVGVGANDTEAESQTLAQKIVNLRVFPNEAGKFDRSLLDVDGEALVVSQFTLWGDCRKGRRPDFTAAARPDLAIPLYEHFIEALKTLGVSHVTTGKFGASMQVTLVNDGPVTLWLDSDS